MSIDQNKFEQVVKELNTKIDAGFDGVHDELKSIRDRLTRVEVILKLSGLGIAILFALTMGVLQLLDFLEVI